MGILPSASQPTTTATSKRKSATTDFTKLAPLTSKGTKNFAGYRDVNVRSAPGRQKGEDHKAANDDMYSDADDEDGEQKASAADEVDVTVENNSLLSPEDALRQGELAEGVRKIKVYV